MSELEEYYQRFYQVLQDDLDQMLTEPDPTKRSPKAIAERLKLAEDCELKLEELSSDTMSGWDQLKPETRNKIMRLIEDDQDEEEEA